MRILEEAWIEIGDIIDGKYKQCRWQKECDEGKSRKSALNPLMKEAMEVNEVASCIFLSWILFEYLS